MEDACDLMAEFADVCTEIVRNYVLWVRGGRPNAKQDPGLKEYLNQNLNLSVQVFTVLLQESKGLSRSADSEYISALNEIMSFGLRAVECLDEMGEGWAAQRMAPEFKQLVEQVVATQRA